MKQYITILLVVIILVIIILHFNNKKEHYALSTSLDVDKINETVKQYYYNKDNREIESINIKNDIELLNKTLSQWLIEFKYPVGSFYVQYADINENYDPQTERLFPADKSPAQLFGGKWEDQWPDEGIFFRTGGTLSQENRLLGLQQWAVKNMYGWTSWAQADNDAPLRGNTGVFTTKDVKPGMCDDRDGIDNGGSNNFDSSRMVISSTGETRVKNRLIKVWRRIS
jgi:hypothetical protein